MEGRCLLSGNGVSPDSGTGSPTVGLISVIIDGSNSDAVGALFPSISADGRYEVFESGTFAGTSLPAPSDIVAGLTVQNDAPNIYLRDRLMNVTTCLSVNTSGNTTGNAASRTPIISANGQYVVFLSGATDLTANDTPGNNPLNKDNVFERNLATGVTTLVSVNAAGTGPGDNGSTSDFGISRNLSVSADGRQIVWESDATNLVANDTNALPDVFVRDMQNGTTRLVSVNAAGTGSGAGNSNNPVISADGSTVAFDSLANNLDPRFTGLPPFSNYQVYARNIQTNTTTLVSDDSTGAVAGNGTSIAPSLSANGQFIAFQSDSTNLVSTPVNGGSIQDIYLRNLAQSAPLLVSVNHTGANGGDSSSFAPQISGDGAHVLFSSLANDLTTNDLHGTDFTSKDVFERDLTTSTTQLVSINATGTNSGNNTSDLANQTTNFASQQSSGQISTDGRYVIFINRGTDLVPNFVKQNDPTFGYDVYLRDTVAGTTTLITHQSGATASGGNQISGTATMTPSGSYVAFQSTASNLVAVDTNAGINQTDVFVSPADYVPVGPGSLALDAGTYSVNENGGPVTVTVSRTGGSTGAVSVQFQTSNGTGLAGTDYIADNQTLSWANGESSSKTTSISIIDRHLTSGSKTVNLTLSAPTGGASLNTPGTAVLTINDTDVLTPPSAPVLAPQSDTGVSNSDGLTKDNGSAAAPLTFTISGVSPSNGFVQLVEGPPGTAVPYGAPVQAVNGSATITLNGGLNLPLSDGNHFIGATVATTLGGPQSNVSATTSIVIQSSLAITDTSPANGGFASALPGGQVTIHFNHPLAGLTDGGPGEPAGNPFAAFLLQRGPELAFGATTGIDSGTLPLHANTIYHLLPDGTSSITLTPLEPLSSDLYGISINLNAYQDLAGNTPTDPTGGPPGFHNFLLQHPPTTGAPLRITGVTSYNGFAAVNNNAVFPPDTLAIAFNKPLWQGAAGGNNVQLLAFNNGNYSVQPSVATYSPSTNTIYLTPTGLLFPGTIYIIRVDGSVSDDQGFSGPDTSPGGALGQTYYDSFSVYVGPATAQAPFQVPNDSHNNPETQPIGNLVWSSPVGYARVPFTEPLDMSPAHFGRFAVMVDARTAGSDNNQALTNIPLNAKLAFNPNTNQLIVVPTQLQANDVYVFILSGLQAQSGDVLSNAQGQPVPVYFTSYLLQAPVSASASSVIRATAVSEGLATVAPLTAPGAPATPSGPAPSFRAARPRRRAPAAIPPRVTTLFIPKGHHDAHPASRWPAGPLGSY